ncbi:MAG TPA: NAD(P)-binding domain-containing protein [Gemmatimonadaceae bacterium]|jgi:cation diffusion facilitator CzcD-associated flavoprotein CzcO|nr:NAD(P)-binding domain-containing protein [Gemmatimonadaceae bacterium]
MGDHTSLLIIGAGPFGLALSAYARAHEIEHTIVGRPMEFWKQHMPKQMLLRSHCDWHLDPLGEHTIEQYLQALELRPKDVEPLSLAFYLDYCNWFIQQKELEIVDAQVESLDRSGESFIATLDNGTTITADRAVIAVGFLYFENIPDSLRALFPSGRFSHTSQTCDFSDLENKSVLIIGGRQSAFEWTALVHEAGAKEIHVSYRHPTPSFEESDWSWVAGAVSSIATEPGWFRKLPSEERDRINQRQWAEGRLKLEPWLAPRITNDKTTLHPESEIVACEEKPNGRMEITLNDGTKFIADHVILATGYKVDVSRIPFLANGNILEQLTTRNNFPALDDYLESNIPGLFFTSMCATQDFGSFFGFTVSVRASASLIGSRLNQSALDQRFESP